VSQAMAIAGRELRAYFLSPGGYMIAALFLLITGGVFFFQSFASGRLASLSSVLGMGTWLLTFIAPAVTMRLLAEEFRLGTFEVLMTAPVRAWQIIAGKFAGALGFVVAMLVPTVVFVVALEMYGRPDYGEVACGYLGLLLAASAYLASGLFASTLTNSQPVAFLLALFFWLTIGLSAKLLPGYLPEQWGRVAFAIDPDLRMSDFTIGLIDTSNIVYFVSITALFLVAAVQSIRARRWQ